MHITPQQASLACVRTPKDDASEPVVARLGRLMMMISLHMRSRAELQKRYFAAPFVGCVVVVDNVTHFVYGKASIYLDGMTTFRSHFHHVMKAKPSPSFVSLEHEGNQQTTT